ncbi:hypothetical protein HANVADRAFT_53298 [Hanseniaspora valbyensis NRRL Y-1626]|uniref:FK506-binding protein n=1 Tax=Hanseniaspora valbyensis NRRL Y-1626 TaxID=766949 RepID=A0A1B7TBY2_9ASCO|nr:hypothetical protein HANVADRAFT_53298 [Hanseniaspora valbyensis NRRL Y-1626]
MSEMLPLAVYGINVIPGEVTSAIDSYPSATVKITSVAVHPESLDGKDTPTTLIMLKRRIVEDENDSEVEDSDEENEDEDEEDDDEEIIEEFVIATLSANGKTQQTVDLTISPDEDIAFVATGSYRIDILGNYVTHPYDLSDSEDYDSEDYSDEYSSEDEELDELDVEEINEEDDDEEEEDLDSEDESYYQDALEALEDASDIEEELNNLIKEANGKRKLAQIEEIKDEEEEEEEKPKKETKKQKKEKSVTFKKGLEEGPAPKKEAKKEEPKKEVKQEEPKKEAVPSKPKARVLEGGVIIEDRTIGKGKQCKKNDKVGMRYIGKLKKNEKKVFDKNVKGKPFVFNLGKGDVIKGWDIGVAGMAVGGERRIIIPAAYAYGRTALPGIPANSDLIFDVKLVSMK